MKNRRDFIKAAALGAGSLAVAKLAKADFAGSQPAITSLLLDDESPVCEPVTSVNGVNFQMEFNVAAGLVPEMITPGGTRLLQTGADSTVAGVCNPWLLRKDDSGPIDYGITTKETQVNKGRYQIFIRSSETVDRLISFVLQAGGGGLTAGNTLRFVTDERRLIGSINMAGDGSAVLRLFGQSQTTAPAPG